MDEYREDVERLARERAGEPFYNSSIEHAAVIIESMFRHAQHEVCIVSKALNGRVFGRDEVVDELDGFLAASTHRVRILLEENISALNEGHSFLRKLRQYQGNWAIRTVPQSVQDAIPYHFTLVDDDSYRFEPNKAEWSAVAAFGDKVGAERLKTAFEAMWHVSTPLDFPVVATAH